MNQKLLVVLPFVLLLSGCGTASSSFQLGAHLGAGESFYEQKNYVAAEGEFKKALATAKGNNDLGECYTRLGQTYMKMGKTSEARQAFRTANSRYEEVSSDLLFTTDKRVWAQGLKDYAQILEKAGDKSQAKSVTTKWKELRKELGPVEDVREKTTTF